MDGICVPLSTSGGDKIARSSQSISQTESSDGFETTIDDKRADLRRVDKRTEETRKDPIGTEKKRNER
jgi:hypothetical protein